MAVETFVHAHQCPRCELRFATRSELEDHLAVDHGVGAPSGPFDSGRPAS